MNLPFVGRPPRRAAPVFGNLRKCAQFFLRLRSWLVFRPVFFSFLCGDRFRVRLWSAAALLPLFPL